MENDYRCDLVYGVVYNVVDEDRHVEKEPNTSEVFLKKAAHNALLAFDRAIKSTGEKTQIDKDSVVFKLPERKNLENAIILPRKRPPAPPKQQTKWEKFAQEKGINKRKKDPLVFDEAKNEWRPRFGYNSKDDGREQAIIETPHDYVPDKGADPFDKVVNKKKENRAKNQYNQLKNTIRNEQQNSIKGVNADLQKKLTQVSRSTASAGVFNKVDKKAAKKTKKTNNRSVCNEGLTEQERMMKVAEKFL